MTFSRSKSEQSSKQTTPEELQNYFYGFDQLTGGTAPTAATPDRLVGKPGQQQVIPGTPGTPGTPGRLAEFAQDGTPRTDYKSGGYTATRPGAIKALGGLGATQLASIQQERQQGRQETAADPSLSIFQRQRSNQLSEQDLDARADAIRKETEAQIGVLSASEAARRTEFGAQEAGRRYEANRANANLTREDLALLAQIFFGGKGSSSSGKAGGFGVGFATPSNSNAESGD